MIPVKISDTFTPGYLSSESANAILTLIPQLTDAWNKRQVFRTETEMRVSVLNDGRFPTKASKYWQSIREQTMMLEQVTLQGFEYRRNEVKLKRAQRQLNEARDELDIEEAQIEVDQCLFAQAQLRQVGEDRVREIKLWEEIKSELDDGSFDSANVNTHQLVSIRQQLINRRDSVTPHTSPDELLNIMGPLSTVDKMEQPCLTS